MDETKRQLFAETLKKVRKEKGLSQKDLANKVGVSFMTLRRYESGESSPDMATLIALCEVLHTERLLSVWGLRKNVEGATIWEIRRRRETFEKVRDALQYQYWNDLVANGNWNFLLYLVKTAKIYETLNEYGVSEALHVIKVLSKIPEYKSKKSWAFVEDSPIENATDDNAEKEDE